METFFFFFLRNKHTHKGEENGSNTHNGNFFFFFFGRMKYVLKYIHQRGKSNKTKVLTSGGTASIQTSKGKECLALWAKACAIALLCRTT